MTEKNGAQVIDIVERFDFNLGSAIECIVRVGREPGPGTIADLEKAQWHLEREINLIKQRREEIASSRSSAIPRASQVCELGKSQQNGVIWQDRMGDKYRFYSGEWEYQTAGQDSWEPVRFPAILTDFGPYRPVVDS
jgi:hypothetical protein